MSAAERASEASSAERTSERNELVAGFQEVLNRRGWAAEKRDNNKNDCRRDLVPNGDETRLRQQKTERPRNTPQGDI